MLANTGLPPTVPFASKLAPTGAMNEANVEPIDARVPAVMTATLPPNPPASERPNPSLFFRFTDIQFLHPGTQGAGLEVQDGRRPLGPLGHPTGFFQNLENIGAFHRRQ